MAGKSETFIKLGLVFFISLLSFAIGTLVGKEYSDRQYKLSKMEPSESHAGSHREVASEHGGVNKLSDEEIAKLAEEFVTDDTVEAAKNAHDNHAPPIDVSDSTAAVKAPDFEEMNDEALDAAQALIDGKSYPTESRKIAGTETTKISTKTTTTSKVPHEMPKNAAQDNAGKFTVQVGAYAKEDEAKARAEKLKIKGYNAFYIPGEVNGKTWYRVNVGTYATIEEAKRANDKYSADNAGQKGFIKEIH